MFDLKPRVHLDEEEAAVLVQELDRAGAAIAELGHGIGDDCAHLLALGGGDDWRWRFLQHLLVAALKRAVALPHMHGVAVSVAEHLKFDVARSEEHTSELQSLMRISYAIFCLKKKQ